MKMQVAVLAGLMLCGCGDDPVETPVVTPPDAGPVVTEVEPARPVGTVSGVVLSAAQTPLADVGVTLTVGSATAPRTTTTDATGAFSFREVPGAAQVLLTFGKSGYATLRATSVVPSSAGNTPVDDGNASVGPVVLTRLDGTVRVQVVAPDGRPAVGARATLHARNAALSLSNFSDAVRTTVVAEATADATGLLTFPGLPSPQELLLTGGDYQLAVQAWDATGDGVFEAAGLVRNYAAPDLLTAGSTKLERLQSAYATGALGPVSSTLSSLVGGALRPSANLVAPGGSASLIFNQPVLPGSLEVGLTDEYAQESLAISGTLSVGNTQLTLTPGITLVPGREYNLRVRAVAVGGASWGATGVLFGGTADSPPALTAPIVRWQETTNDNGLVDVGETVQLHFNQVLTARLLTANAQVFFGADLNGSGVIGDGQGERHPTTGKVLSPSAGFPLLPLEPTAPVATRVPAEAPVFPIVTSGYTTRFGFTFGSASAPFNPTANVPVTVLFSALNPVTDAYETGWGVVRTADLTFQSSALVPIPVPR